MHRLCLESLNVVLVHPANAGNIGATARVLKNFGVKTLILVKPKVSPLHPEALSRACKAQDILYNAVVFNSLEDALAPFHYVVGTTARARYKRSVVFPREIASYLTALSGKNKIALLFGPERTGLTNKVLDMCHALVTIPTAPEHSSLNLAQAVGVILYELFYHSLTGGASQRLPRLATSQELEAMYKHLIEALSPVGFVLGGKRGHTYRVLKRLFSKIPLTESDVRVIRGICRQIIWYVKNSQKKF
ncbi:MAG: RNA methyltransferase [Candidatus Desulfofervidaceae bacterium]|nr:RNA methyltransferase [Candidatus Desulfofervidaceae bacterium]MDL1971421.1 RNA methyltransferase [Candidatus Desulfofervidaceae bacterium]